MHAFLHVLGIAALAVGGVVALLVVVVIAFFAMASANGENPFQ